MRVLLMVILLLGLAPASGGLAPPESPTPVPLIGFFDGIVEPSPMHAPVAETNVGIGPGAPIFIHFPGTSGTYICTANFLWTSGGKTYLGTAGHCLLPEGKAATHGPGADYNASGVVVHVCVWGCSIGGLTGASLGLGGNLVRLGPVAYARQHTGGDQVGEDFGVVEIPTDQLHLVRPSLPVWRGPTTPTPGSGFGPVCHYGQGVLVGETFATMARAGSGLGTLTDGSWAAAIAINGGDSGSAIVQCSSEGTAGFHGRAPLGVITHGLAVPIAGAPILGYGMGTTIAKAQVMATQAQLNLTLVTGS